MSQHRVITFGTFDLLHEGHIRILERARALGDYLIVGVSTDALNALKGKRSIFSQDQRRAYLDALKMVDETFFEESLDLKDEYVKRYNADLLVMGDDWAGQFDWVSCRVIYLPRTPGISSTDLKTQVLRYHRMQRVLFGDTYLRKHYDCALSMVSQMLDAGIAPVFTQTQALPRHLNIDCIVYFNRPVIDPPPEYDGVMRLCIDHGASNLKWFLAGTERYHFFDRILTAGPDHTRSLLTFFPEPEPSSKVRSAAFIKTPDLLAPPRSSREEICARYGLRPDSPIVLFAPTWYIYGNVDLKAAIRQIAGIDNHVAVLHPETRNFDAAELNLVDNVAGTVTELLKHADCVISDLSSTMFEAAALRKPVVQILMREYSDNGAKCFDFPYVAGTADLFCGGVVARPEQIKQVVQGVLSDSGRYVTLFRACQERILRGTIMNDEAATLLTSELLAACGMTRPPPKDIGAVEQLRALGIRRAHENLGLSRSQVIAHAGGNYNRRHASNALEAITASFSAVEMVEVDLVRGRDGILLAHDGYEQRYGFDRPFVDVAVNEFTDSKFEGELTPLALDGLFELLGRTDGMAVLDVKAVDDEYGAILVEVCAAARARNVIDRVIVQAYSRRDFERLIGLGFQRSILALWKYHYSAPLGEESHRFVRECIALSEPVVYGISVPYVNHHLPQPSIDMDELLPFFAYWKRVFIHGAPQARYAEILRRNMGLFADGFKPDVEFRDVGVRFPWREYMFLNPLLVANGIDNHVSAVCHWVEWGRKEERMCRYQVPDGFSWRRYLELNPDLRSRDVCGEDSAKAHWTRHGSREGRPF